MNFVPSFFNLKVELLIEGMVGANCCYDYKFNAERGYNDTYFDQVSFVHSFALFYIITFYFILLHFIGNWLYGCLFFSRRCTAIYGHD